MWYAREYETGEPKISGRCTDTRLRMNRIVLYSTIYSCLSHRVGRTWIGRPSSYIFYTDRQGRIFAGRNGRQFISAVELYRK